MSDQEPVPGPTQASEQVPAPPPPPRMACPRCRGTFEGSPDFCPHCGFSKAEAATLSSQGLITPPLETPAAETAAVPAAGPVDETPPAAPETLPPPVSAEDGDAPEKSRRWILALPLVVLLLAGGYWFMSKEDSEKPVQEDACATFREELLEVQAKDFPNPREERRAVAELNGRARDAGCDSDDLRSET